MNFKKPSHSTSSMNHEQCRQKVYIVCWFKTGNDGRVLNDDDDSYKLIKENTEILNQIEHTDSRVPTGICTSCRLKLKNYQSIMQTKWEIEHGTFARALIAYFKTNFLIYLRFEC